jgi:hypothetical protein|nr:MAG TPA: Protein of unknown function (DUF1642) [Caudoviricetes sp.]
MNKRELIKEYEGARFAMVTVNSVLEDLKQLDEPQKPVVPQFVADWIKYCKNTLLSLTRALMVNEIDFYNYANQEDHSRLITFLESEINQRIFARAWLDGYTVEKEKRYLVKMKGVTDQTRTLKRNIDMETWYFGNPNNYEDVNAHHTRKELESAGFGWVFDCEGIEVKEVKE